MNAARSPASDCCCDGTEVREVPPEHIVQVRNGYGPWEPRESAPVPLDLAPTERHDALRALRQDAATADRLAQRAAEHQRRMRRRGLLLIAGIGAALAGAASLLLSA